MDVEGEGIVTSNWATVTTAAEGEVANMFDYAAIKGTKLSNYDITVVTGKIAVVKGTPNPDDDPGKVDPSVDPSDPEQIEDPTIKFSPWDYVGMYDGAMHTIDTNAMRAAYAAVVGEELSIGFMDTQDGAAGVRALPPVFKDVVATSFWYKVSSPNYNDIIHPCKVIITNRPVTVMSGTKLDLVYDGKPHAYTNLTVTSGSFVAGEGIATSNWATVTMVAEGQVDNAFDYAPLAGTKLENYDFAVVTGKIAIAQAGAVTVTITGRVSVVTYDGSEKSVSGYDIVSISDPLYKATDFKFTGIAATNGTDAGTYPMGLKPSDFVNTNGNFSSVTFNVTDGWLKIEPNGIQKAIGNAGKVEKTPDGWKVTLTNDASSVTIPDDFGNVVFDLAGRMLVGSNGHDGTVTSPGGNGGAALLIGTWTVVSLTNSAVARAYVTGGKAGDGNPAGDGGPGILVGEGTRVNIGANITVAGGAGGADLSDTGIGGNGGAGVEGDVGTNEGDAKGGDGGPSEKGKGGDGGAGIKGDVEDNKGTTEGGNGGSSVAGYGGNGGVGVEGDVGTNEGDAKGGDGGESEHGEAGEGGRAIGGNLIVDKSVGEYVSLDIEEDLGVEIDADYASGDKVSVKIEGLVKGLKLVTKQYTQKISKKKTIVTNAVYTIEGIPTETIDFAKQPMYARVAITKDGVKTETLTPLMLDIAAAEVETFPEAFLASNYVVDVRTLWPDADASWQLSGLPSGLKYNASAKPAVTKKTTKVGKKTVTTYVTNALPFEVYGKPTKAGTFTLTFTQTQKAGKKTTTLGFRKATLTVWPEAEEADYRYTDQAYIALPYEGRPVDDTVTAASGLPTGVKFTAKDVVTVKKSGKKVVSVTTNAFAHTFYGTPTKAGVYAVTLTKPNPSNKKKTVVVDRFLWKVTEGENGGFLDAIDWKVEDSTVTVMQGIIQTNWNVTVSSAAKVTAAGLPTGLKLAQNKTTKAWTLSGTPSKTGNYVVTITTVLNGVTKTERIAMAVTANPYAGSWYAAPFEDGYSVSWTAYISAAAGGTVKLVLTEGTTNTNAKGVLVSQVTKTTVTAKNLDGDGKSVYFTLPRDKKVAGSVDRSCVVDFDKKTIEINGEEQCAEIYYKSPFDFEVPAVATMVLEEFVEDKVSGNSTNAFAYLTATYNKAKGIVGVQGKLYDGTAVKATTYALEDANGGCAPFLVTDKSKNSISILISYTFNKGKGEFRLMQCAVIVNGQILRIGKASLNPSWDGFDSAEAKVLKETKFSDMTSAVNLVVELTADAIETIASTRGVSVDEVGTTASLVIPVKSRATKLTAQGLVTFKSLKDADGWTWTCELLPVGEMVDGDTPFRGIARGTKKIGKKTYTVVCPVRTE